jgi:hypothetical protein
MSRTTERTLSAPNKIFLREQTGCPLFPSLEGSF